MESVKFCPTASVPFHLSQSIRSKLVLTKTISHANLCSPLLGTGSHFNSSNINDFPQIHSAFHIPRTFPYNFNKCCKYLNQRLKWRLNILCYAQHKVLEKFSSSGNTRGMLKGGFVTGSFFRPKNGKSWKRELGTGQSLACDTCRWEAVE